MKISKKNILWESSLNEVLTCFSKINLSYSLTSITIIKIGIFFKRKYPKEIEFLNLTYFLKIWDSFNTIYRLLNKIFNHISNKRQEEFILIKITSSTLSTSNNFQLFFFFCLGSNSKQRFGASLSSKIFRAMYFFPSFLIPSNLPPLPGALESRNP